MRVGIGYDLHRLVRGRKLILGGVAVPFGKGLLGHSDADVLTHAVIDAVLGAMGEKDIGEHFPDTDARYRGADSLVLARRVRGMLKKKGLRVAQIDSVVIAERPKLGPYKEAIRRSLSKAFGAPFSRTTVKAKTNEGLDAVGEGKAIAAHAVACLA